MSFTPRSFSVRGTGAPIWLRWTLSTRRDLWSTWSAFSDTDRFNRAGGLNHELVDSLDADGTLVRMGRVRELGLDLRWIERLFDYERPRGFRAEREFLNGPSRGYALDVRFEASESGTQIHYQVAGFARWFWIRPLTWLIYMCHVRPMVGRALDRIIESLETSAEPQPVPMKALDSTAQRRLEDALRKVSDEAVASRLGTHLQEGTEAEQSRLEPQELAARWGLGIDSVVDGCLEAARAGALSLRWDLLCPSCHGPKSRLEKLDLDGESPHCTSCNIRYDSSLADNVVVSFKTLLRPVDGVTRCIGNPSATPHILARQDLQPGEDKLLEMKLEPGRYRLRQLDQLGGCSLEVGVEAGGHGAVFNLEPHGIGPDRAQLQAGPVAIRLRNMGSRASRVVLEDAGCSFPGVTFAQLLHRPASMELLSTDVLPPELDVELRRQAVVMVECLGPMAPTVDAVRERLRGTPPSWEHAAHRYLALGFEDVSKAIRGLSQIAGCMELCSAATLGPVMEIHGLAGETRHAGPALDQGKMALSISIPGGAALAQECTADPDIVLCLSRGNPVKRAVPGPLLRGRIDQLLEFVAPRPWEIHKTQTIAEPDELIGQVIRDRYRVDSRLAEGGFGVIFSAVDLETDDDVVVKLLHPRLARKRGVAQGFFNEARACMGLDSPFIVRMTDFGHTRDGHLYCVMEHLLGRNLAELPTHVRTPEFVSRILLDVLRGLEEVHAAHLVHRDIKPSNILVVRGQSGSARGRLIDFGIALHVLEPDPSARPGELVGSAPFISPEQLNGSRPGPSADIYAVGMVFYRCLAGEYPFPEIDSLPQLLKRAVDAVPSLETVSRHALPEGLAALVDSALDRDPGRRPESAKAFVRDLKLVLGMESSSDHDMDSLESPTFT